MNQKVPIRHKTNLTNNLHNVNELLLHYPENGSLENKIDKITFFSLNLLLTNHKNNLSYLRNISKLLYDLNKRYTNMIIENMVKMEITGQKIEAIKNILDGMRFESE